MIFFLMICMGQNENLLWKKDFLEQSQLVVVENGNAVTQKEWDALYFWDETQWKPHFVSNSGRSAFKKIDGVTYAPDGRTALIVGSHEELHQGKPAVFLWRDRQLSLFMGYLENPKIQLEGAARDMFKKTLKESFASKLNGNPTFCLFFWSWDSKHVLLVVNEIYYRINMEKSSVSYGGDLRRSEMKAEIGGYGKRFVYQPDIYYRQGLPNPIIFSRSRVMAMSWETPVNDMLLKYSQIPSRKDLYGKKVKAWKKSDISFGSIVYDGYYAIGRFLLDHQGGAKLGLGKKQDLVHVERDQAYVVHYDKKELIVYDLGQQAILSKNKISQDLSWMGFLDGRNRVHWLDGRILVMEYDQPKQTGSVEATVYHVQDGFEKAASFPLEGRFLRVSEGRIFMVHDGVVFAVDAKGRRIDLISLPEARNLNFTLFYKGLPFLNHVANSGARL